MLELVGAGLAGYSAALVMEHASTWLYEHESPRAREREEQLRQEMPTTVPCTRPPRCSATRSTTSAPSGSGRSPTTPSEPPAAQPPASSRRLGALPAALAVAGAMSLVVDEGLNAALRLTPPQRAFPLAAHLRGFGAHAVYGLALGALLAAGQSDPRPRRWTR